MIVLFLTTLCRLQPCVQTKNIKVPHLDVPVYVLPIFQPSKDKINTLCQQLHNYKTLFQNCQSSRGRQEQLIFFMQPNWPPPKWILAEPSKSAKSDTLFQMFQNRCQVQQTLFLKTKLLLGGQGIERHVSRIKMCWKKPQIDNLIAFSTENSQRWFSRFC